MRASPCEKALLNLAQYLPPTALYYTDRGTALERLRDMTGKDFGDDYAAWERYCMDNGFVWSRWIPIAPENKAPTSKAAPEPSEDG